MIANSLQKLILSNTLEYINHLDIFNEQINLTIWMQIRYPFYNEIDNSLKSLAFRITDQNNQDQFTISIFSDKQRIIFDYDLQNQIQDYQSLEIKNKSHEWIYINVCRNTCFDRLYNKNINITIKCNEQFNATLFTFRQKQFQIFIYDQMEFKNEEIRIYNIALIKNLFKINILKNDLEILFYVKYYCNIQQEGSFYKQFIQKDSDLDLYFSQDFVYVLLQISKNQFHKFVDKKIQYDQWLFIFIQFIDLDVRIQFTFNNQINEQVLQLDRQIYFQNKNEYIFFTEIILINSYTVRYDSLLIVNNIEQKKNYHFCYKDCQNCVDFICYDHYRNINQIISISHDVQMSNYFRNQFPNNYEYICTDKIFFIQNNTCVEWPKYYGEYCFNCQYYQQKSSNMAYQINLILDLNYLYYFDQLYNIPEDFKLIPLGLYYEQDINIFIFKIKDIYLIYKTAERFYCENGYFYSGFKCVKQLRKCQLQNRVCMLCSQNYSIHNLKCVRCQQNCLFCRIINKKISCILFVNSYFQDDFGLLKKCQDNISQLACQEKDDIIQNLQSRGHQVCQLMGEYYIYDPQYQTEQCYHTNFKVIGQYLLNNQNQIKIYQQKLEIQDMILLQNQKDFDSDDQINLLICHQQINRLSQVVNYLNKNFIHIKRQQNFEYLSITKQTKENINTKKYIFYDVKLFLGSKPIIVYQNQEFSSIINLFENSQIELSSVQFDILFTIYETLDTNLRFAISNDIKEFYNKSLILNLTFQINPSIIYSKCLQFRFQANEIIINNLLLSNFYSKCSLEQFELISDYIFINNLIVQNSNLVHLFICKDFKSLRLHNFKIIDSEVKILLIAEKLYNQQENSNLELENIQFFGSQISCFIEIYKVKNISIGKILYKDTILNHNTISILDYAHQVNIYDIVYDNVTLNQAISIDFLVYIYCYFIRIENITAYNVNLVKSKIIRITEVGQTFISQIQLENVYFYLGSSFIQFDTIVNCEIQKIIFKKIFLNQSKVFDMQSVSDLLLMDLYFMTIHLFKSSFFNSQNDYTNITNLNIQNVKSLQSDIIISEGKFIYLNKLNIENFEINNENKDNNQIIILSIEIIIENVILKNLILTNSNLMIMQSYLNLWKNLEMINVQVINEFQNQLILIKNNYFLFLNLIRFQILNISSKTQYYCIMKLINIQEVKIQKLFLNQINANLQSDRTVFIDCQAQQLELLHSDCNNIFQIQLINSKSERIFFFNFTIKNILVSNPLIYIQPYQLSFYSDIVQLQYLNVFNMSGSILEVMALKHMLINCQNITINNFLDSDYLLKFISNKNLNILLTNIIVQNQQNMIENSNLAGIMFLFQSPFKILIQQIYINYTNYQIFFINQTNDLYIIGLYIYNSYNQIINIIENSTFNNKIQLSTFNLVNISTLRSVIDFKNFNNLTKIRITSILLKNVSSQTSIFHSDTLISLYNSFIIGGTPKFIFRAHQQIIKIKQSLITDINQLCILSESKVIKIQGSEIADSQIIYDDQTLILKQSAILGNYVNQNNKVKIFLSLNNGQSVFHQQYLDNNLYQFQFSQNNNYLYLPSGQNIEKYEYFNFKTCLYNRLYDSISFISKYKLQQILCNLTQVYENQLIYNQQLILSPGVNIINNMVVTLNPFHKDKHIILDLICNQDNQIMTYRTLIKTFKCQLGEYFYKDQCQFCDIDKQLYSVEYNQSHCQYADTNKIQELKIGQIKLYPQYWRFQFSNKYIEFCQTENCLGEWKTGDSSCKIGYVGAICSECDMNNIRGDGNYGKIDDQCRLCYLNQSIYFKIIFVIIYQLALVYSNYYTNKQQSEQYLFIRITQRKFTEILLKQNVNQATIVLKLYFNYLFTLFLLKESIYFGFYITFSLNIIYNPNITAVPQFDCLIHSMIQLPVQYSQLLYKIIMPVLIFNVFIIIYIILIKLGRSRHSMYIVIVCLITIFQQNQYIILQSLIRLSQKIQYSNMFWILEDKASQFYSKTHQQYLITVIMPLIILFIFLNIIIFCQIKKINKRIFYNMKLSLFIQKQYKNRFYFWEYLRISFIYLFMITVSNEDYNFYVIILIVLFCCINQTYKPYVLNNLNQIDQLILLFSIFSYFVILMVRKINSFHTFIILIFSNILLLKIYINYFIHSFNHQYRKMKQKFNVQLIKFIPQLNFLITLQNTDKLNYHYLVLKYASKKSNSSMSSIFPNMLCKSNPYTPIEIELKNLNIK